MKREQKRLHDSRWLVMPDDVEAQIAAWRRVRPDIFVDDLESFSGHSIYALTLTDTSVPEEDKKVLFFQQPHGHEPAETAGAMELLSELITGESLDGRPTKLDVPTLLSRLVVIINPLGNPDGRSRSPVEVFDDSFTFIEGAYYWNGKLRGDDWFFIHAGRFNLSEHDFDPDYPIGLRYEQVSDGVFSDPWNDPASELTENPTSMARLARTILDRHRVDAIVDLHQYPEQDFVHVWVADFPDAEATERAHRMAQRVEDDWAKAGFHVSWRFKYPYGKYIRTLHEHGSAHPPVITVEVGGGVGHRNALMHRRMQGAACASAIRSVMNLYGGL